jgi:monoterpene epsilon-lactone hydrolase
MYPPKPVVDGKGSVHLPSMTVPFSSLASTEAKQEFIRARENLEKVNSDLSRYSEVSADNIREQRQALIDSFEGTLDRTRALYPVTQENCVIAGVACEVFTPRAQGDKTKPRPILINLHGGTFLMGAHLFSALESIPLASLGGFTVVAVDYKLGPEHKFPAATEDVVAVYRQLLKRRDAAEIGIYGCSAGGLLTAQAVALLCNREIPLPGAVGLFAASACGWAVGDSGSLAMPLSGLVTPAELLAPPRGEVCNVSYFSEVDMSDPLALPIRSDAILQRFPPTLLMTSTRDPALSGAAHTHAQLTRLGVEAALHVWDGLPHSFFAVSPDLPETLQAWTTSKNFFERHLGARGQPRE